MEESYTRHQYFIISTMIMYMFCNTVIYKLSRTACMMPGSLFQTIEAQNLTSTLFSSFLCLHQSGSFSGSTSITTDELPIFSLPRIPFTSIDCRLFQVFSTFPVWAFTKPVENKYGDSQCSNVEMDPCDKMSAINRF